MPSSLSNFSRLRPYVAQNRGLLTLGGVALIAANYLDIKVLTLMGQGIDLIGWKLDPFADLRFSLLNSFLLCIAALAVAAAIARFWMRWWIIGASRQIEFGLRNDLFAHLENLSASFFDRYSTGDIMARSTNDLESVRLVIGPAVMYLSGTAVMLPMSLYQMIQISPRLTLMSWLPLTLIAPLFYVFEKRIHDLFTKVQETFSEISTRVQETLTGIRVVKAFAREEQESARFDVLSRRYVAENIRLNLIQSLFFPFMGFFIGLSLLALVWTGGIMVAQGGTSGGISHGRLISFFVLLMANIWPLAAIGWVLSLLERGSASMRRINELFEVKPEVVEPARAARVPAKLKGRVLARHLTFHYSGAARPALNEISFDLAPGKALGLTGPVGCGKSTLADLLARRYNPPRGTLFIDGVDLLDWPLKDYRRQIAIVDQEPFLFSDTITANIAYGLGEVDLPKVERAGEIAQLSEDVRAFPSAFETMLGERGINLSGGQRQRAALARALATDPALLILDDALAAVDTHTEERILRGLKEFMTGRTTILISHRITTVSIADHILYLEDGRIVEEGTHEELIAGGGKYWSLARKQQLAEEIEATA